MRAPRPIPTSRSFRYEPAQSASPASTGRSKVKTFFETPPVEVMTTTISTCGCSSRTSIWRIVVVLIGGGGGDAGRIGTLGRGSGGVPLLSLAPRGHHGRAGLGG